VFFSDLESKHSSQNSDKKSAKSVRKTNLIQNLQQLAEFLKEDALVVSSKGDFCIGAK
jgi:hypothetical protein